MRLTVWLNRSALDGAFQTCSQFYPREAGGLLFGYRAAPLEFVIEQISGPGPNAAHDRRTFVPDYDFDEKLAVTIYENTRGHTSYLGDWHSHPDTTSSYLSYKDRRAIKSVLRSEDAQLSATLSMVIAGSASDGWSQKIWAAELVRTCFIFEMIAAVPAAIKIYE